METRSKRINRDGDGDRAVPHRNRPEAQPLAEDYETDDVDLRDMNIIEGEKENERTNTIETLHAENAADPDQDQPIDTKNRREGNCITVWMAVFSRKLRPLLRKTETPGAIILFRGSSYVDRSAGWYAVPFPILLGRQGPIRHQTTRDKDLRRTNIDCAKRNR
ncbi:hypothetical protein QE152_g36101 [Popillia japonica]|uniref:Uncharacterized protein n=1 Tax=Popillia japonica TaxID=7064 RepID=A0AAW1IDC1_POPJA